MSAIEDSITHCLDLLDSAFLKAIAEPVRIEILKVVVRQGRCDVATVAEHVPQDRSVVARHLQLLARTNILIASSEGRHTYYQVDGEGIVENLKVITLLAEQLTPLCCPAPS